MDTLGVIILAGLLLAIVFKLINVYTCGMCTSDANLTGKVVIVTGSDRGIGYATAEDLARRGARVILACVDEPVAKKAQKRMIKATGNKDIEYKFLDLSSFESIRAFAKDFLENEERLDVLINNAGVVFQGQKRTEDGLLHEEQINYFGPFLLTNLLLPTLQRSVPSRIVNVASCMHWIGNSDFNRIGRTRFSNVLLYSDTKLYIVYFTKELSRRLAGTGVVANSLHPGAVRSNIYHNAPFPLYFASKIYNNVFFKTEIEGAQTSIHLAVSKDCENISGHYFTDCKPKYGSPRARNRNKARELWELSVKIVGLNY